MSERAGHVAWPADGLDAWWDVADHVAHDLAKGPHGSEPQAWLDYMHGVGWASLCAESTSGGHGQPMSVLCRVIEALSAVNASAAAAVYASAAAHLALRACALPDGLKATLRDLAGEWLAWPAFHDIDEQLWPTMDAQGYLRGQVDMLLMGQHAHWAVLPAQGRDQGLQLVLVDLRHPAVIRGPAIRTLGLPACGLNDVEFGGVPCEVLTTQGTALFRQVAAQLAPAVMAMQCGLSRASLQDAQQHAACRQQGGGVLLGWGEVRRLLSLMHERLGVMQGLLLAALTAPDAPGVSASYSALHAGELACAQTVDGVQLLGGAGYVRESMQAQRLCDARQAKGLLGGVAWRRQGLFKQALSA